MMVAELSRRLGSFNAATTVLIVAEAAAGGDATLLTQIAQIRRHVDDGESAPRLFLGFDDDEECAALDRRLGGEEVAEGSER